MCLCVKCRCSDLSGEGTFSPVCSFWTSTKHHFLPSFPFPMILNEFKSWNQQEASRKSHFKNIQFAFRCLLPNYWLKTINHIVSQKHDSSPSPSDLFFLHKHSQVTGTKENTQTGWLLSSQVQVGA